MGSTSEIPASEIKRGKLVRASDKKSADWWRKVQKINQPLAALSYDMKEHAKLCHDASVRVSTDDRPFMTIPPDRDRDVDLVLARAADLLREAATSLDGCAQDTVRIDTIEAGEYRCKVCGTPWRCHPDGTWSIRTSRLAERCCDNHPGFLLVMERESE